MIKHRRQVYAFPKASEPRAEVTPREWQQWLRAMADEIGDNPWVTSVHIQWDGGPVQFGVSRGTGMFLEGEDDGTP